MQKIDGPNVTDDEMPMIVVNLASTLLARILAPYHVLAGQRHFCHSRPAVTLWKPLTTSWWRKMLNFRLGLLGT